MAFWPPREKVGHVFFHLARAWQEKPNQKIQIQIMPSLMKLETERFHHREFHENIRWLVVGLGYTLAVELFSLVEHPGHETIHQLEKKTLSMIFLKNYPSILKQLLPSWNTQELFHCVLIK